jgi:hypothetical protein
MFESVIIWLFYTAYANAVGDWRLVWVIVSPLTGLFVGLFLVPPMFTHHLAGEKSIRLRMGFLINETVPYSWIKEVKETSVHRGGLRVGIGVRYFHISKMLFVTSSFSSLVTMKFDGEHSMGRLRKKRVEEVIISVRFATPVIETLRERIASAKGE